MLQPHEDAATETLVFECSTCHHIEKSLTACIYRNSLKEDIAETPGNVDDVLEDPTVRDPDSSAFNNLSMDDDEDEEEDDGMLDAPDFEPFMCTMCGQEVLCPTCGRPTDRCLAYEVTDPDGPASKEDVRAEAMERQLSQPSHKTS
jgi:DNA-directed RNA polymerase II subunit RPB9